MNSSLTISSEDEALFNSLYSLYNDGQPSLLKRAIHDASSSARASGDADSLKGLIASFFAHIIALQEKTKTGNIPPDIHVMEEPFVRLWHTLPVPLGRKVIRLLMHTNQMMNNTISLIREKVTDDEEDGVWGSYMENLEKTLDKNPHEPDRKLYSSMYIGPGVALILMSFFTYLVIPLLLWDIPANALPYPINLIFLVVSLLGIAIGIGLCIFDWLRFKKLMSLFDKAFAWDEDAIKKALDELDRMSDNLNTEFQLLQEELDTLKQEMDC